MKVLILLVVLGLVVAYLVNKSKSRH